MILCMGAFYFPRGDKMAKEKNPHTVVSDAGIEVYPDDIAIYAAEYEAALPHPENLYKLSSSSFTGLIKYINKKMGFSYNKKMYEDIDLMCDIWDRYVDIVYKYDQKPVIEEFSMMVGMSKDTLYSWANGEYRDDMSGRFSCKRSDVVRKWLEECKLGRYKGAAAGNVGYIFLCKAVDGLTETAPVHVEAPRRELTVEALPRLVESPQGTDDIE